MVSYAVLVTTSVSKAVSNFFHMERPASARGPAVIEAYLETLFVACMINYTLVGWLVG